MEIQKAYYSLQKRMASALTDEDHFIEFQRLHTDEERVKFTLDLMLKYNVLPNVCPATKNANESEKLRTLGNNIFVSKSLTNTSYEQALELYTKSIAYAPYPSEQLTLAYANRSAALFKLKKYEECIRDIDRALALNYPDYLKAKIYIRKIECLEALEHPNADNGIKEAQQWLDKMPLNCDYCKKLKETLISKDKMPKLCSSKRQTDAKRKTKYTFPEIKTPNTEIPCASDAISIKYNKQYGRHLVATRKIDPGEVIAIEKAYSTLYSLDNMYTHCSYCLIPCWSNIPCNYCPYSMYCSEECKTLDWEKYHDMECSVIPFMFKLDFSTTELFSVRIAVQAVKESPSIRELRQELREVDTCNGN
ncbi:SET and MYND domain-containing protein 4-like [Hylaeus volcanicus]|uniref:SET and MYND domain-containing protein 4-like n=1 Tax=Hylaeus volcanicus TaxID=313075 RepID=UPI0023B81B18|nr:SET and MYND domain-containing protein 4-like [Hylaeus volcanicus]